MVDFNSENVLTADKSNIMIIRIIEKDYYVVEALEKCDRLKYQNTKSPLYIAKASIKSLYNTIKPNVKAIDKEIHKQIILLLESEEFKDFLLAYELIGDWLYKSGVVRFVNKQKYNARNPLEEAKAKGVA